MTRFWSSQPASLGRTPGVTIRKSGPQARRIGAISQKMLSQTLKSLERDGLVSRAAYATVPVTVEYRLTEMAQGLIGILDQITRWAEGHVGAIMDARRAHDAREAEAA